MMLRGRGGSSSSVYEDEEHRIEVVIKPHQFNFLEKLHLGHDSAVTPAGQGMGGLKALFDGVGGED